MTRPVVPYITAADAEGRLDWLTMTAALAAGHRRALAGIEDTFLRCGPDTLLSRSAWVEGLGVGVKSVTVMPDNPARGRPAVQGAFVLFDGETGAVEAVLDSALVTYWKTAADSLLGARLLARPDSRRLLILGAGALAESLVSAYRAGFPGIQVAIWNRTEARAQALADRSGAEVATDLAAAVGAADIVATATMSTAPVLSGAWLRDGQHLDLIGAYRADMREVDDLALTRSRLFVDSRETTLGHIGELRDPIARGVISPGDVAGDLYEVVAGTAGRRSWAEITLFKNGGGAHLDLMTARAILAALAGDAAPGQGPFREAHEGVNPAARAGMVRLPRKPLPGGFHAVPLPFRCIAHGLGAGAGRSGGPGLHPACPACERHPQPHPVGDQDRFDLQRRGRGEGRLLRRVGPAQDRGRCRPPGGRDRAGDPARRG